ncbi:PhnD/SsuA/transferrin family substrate-binding protein [Hoeflea alexandrii]|uniref:PhnD/SsuA/transferrin family substrate-binding protein n=1 Tax=Hoeflea alexandrii TaxID=288436 RepID=UPI0022AF2186|nr:PhnD/SsuA/transferrin family substrate-binding protein [Hoeflea alexandrii]MCZ4289015.1 PhnD/SsuA/transferrin family substrate-binding protein [Hoeflea alexandrii]
MHFPKRFTGVLVMLCGLLAAGDGRARPSAGDDAAAPRTAHIGVLAYRGNAAALAEWRSLAAYLGDSVEGWRFELIPVSLSSVESEIEADRLDFLITNPGHYVALAARHDLSAIATRERWAEISNSHLSRFGTAIIVAKDSPVASLNDLKGRKLAAVSPDAFGGFQVAWSQMQTQGVDAFRDLASLRFMGFPHDEIVAAVARGEVDAGVIRAGLLETLAGDGQIRLEDFRVLNAQDHRGFPYRVSGPLFSEWPFAALRKVDKHLRETVLIALLRSQDQAIASAYGLRDLWSAPLSYETTRKLVGRYQERVTLAAGTTEAGSSSGWLAVVAALMALGLTGAGLYARRRGEPAASGAGQAEAETPAEFRQYEERMKSLTSREREILELICNGKQTRAIAGALGISPKTVEFHRTNLLHKTEAGTMAHLVQIATRLGYDQGVSLG